MATSFTAFTLLTFKMDSSLDPCKCAYLSCMWDVACKGLELLTTLVLRLNTFPKASGKGYDCTVLSKWLLHVVENIDPNGEHDPLWHCIFALHYILMFVRIPFAFQLIRRLHQMPSLF